MGSSIARGALTVCDCLRSISKILTLHVGAQSTNCRLSARAASCVQQPETSWKRLSLFNFCCTFQTTRLLTAFGNMLIFIFYFHFHFKIIYPGYKFSLNTVLQLNTVNWEVPAIKLRQSTGPYVYTVHMVIRKPAFTNRDSSFIMNSITVNMIYEFSRNFITHNIDTYGFIHTIQVS